MMSQVARGRVCVPCRQLQQNSQAGGVCVCVCVCVCVSACEQVCQCASGRCACLPQTLFVRSTSTLFIDV